MNRDKLHGAAGRLAALGVVVLVVAPAAAGDLRVSDAMAVVVTNGGVPYAGDGPTLATVRPNGDGYRDTAWIRFGLDEPATVTVVVAAVGQRARKVFERTRRLRAGAQTVEWRPKSWLPPRTYVVRLVVRGADGNVRRYGYERPVGTAAIRVLGIDAAATRESYVPGSVAELELETDLPSVTMQVFRAGEERFRTPANAMHGKAVTEPHEIVRTDRLDGPRRLRFWVGDWHSGLYFVRLTGARGETGYAPFVVRPRRLGEHRVAVVLPTYTWQAYNFRDRDGDGYGDTWYAGGTDRTLLGRPYLDRGVPPFFRAYDLNFLRWLARGVRGGKDRGVDFLADSDLARVRDAPELVRAYDLLVFPGHHEYVTRREYALVRGFRDRGGNLMFLSANNFFWRIDRRAGR